LIDAKLKLLDALQMVLAEFKEELPVWPQSLKQIAEQMESEVKSRAAAMDKVHTEIGELKPDTLLEQSGNESETIRKLLVEKSAQAFKSLLPEANKSISAFRTAARKEVKEFTKKRKACQKALTSATIPKFAPDLKDLAVQVTDGYHNVVTNLGDNFDFDTVHFQKMPASMKAALAKLNTLTSHVKWLFKQMAKDEAMTTATAAYRPQLLKQVVPIVRKEAEALMSNIVMPSELESLRDDIFLPQHWALQEHHLHTGALPYACSEVRYLIDGTYLIAGVKFSDLPGESLKDKLDKIGTSAGMAAFIAKALR
jgi:hypothetical protein